MSSFEPLRILIYELSQISPKTLVLDETYIEHVVKIIRLNRLLFPINKKKKKII